MKNVVSYQDLYKIIGEFRKENNDRFDKIERIFERHCEEQTTIFEKTLNRISSLEKIADRALLIVFFVSGIIGLIGQIAISWVKKELRI